MTDEDLDERQNQPTDWYAGMTEKHYDIALRKAVAAERERCAQAFAEEMNGWAAIKTLPQFDTVLRCGLRAIRTP